MAAIAFLGLGNMGGPMAKNLLAAGHALTVFDLVEAACAAVAAEGASIAASAAEAAAQGATRVGEAAYRAARRGPRPLERGGSRG